MEQKHIITVLIISINNIISVVNTVDLLTQPYRASQGSKINQN